MLVLCLPALQLRLDRGYRRHILSKRDATAPQRANSGKQDTGRGADMAERRESLHPLPHAFTVAAARDAASTTVVIVWCFLVMRRHSPPFRPAQPTLAGHSRRGMRLVAMGRNWDSPAMNKDKSATKSQEKSYTLVIVVSFVIAVMMPFVRAVATGETNVAAAYATVAPTHVSATSALTRGNGSDELSLFVVGAFLLGLGSVLRRVA
jgi:hypothetical protein